MTQPDLPGLRREMHAAQLAYTNADRTYWATRHDPDAFRTWEATAAQLDRALTALLVVLAPDDADRAEVVTAQARLHRGMALAHERARLEALRAET